MKFQHLTKPARIRRLEKRVTSKLMYTVNFRTGLYQTKNLDHRPINLTRISRDTILTTDLACTTASTQFYHIQAVMKIMITRLKTQLHHTELNQPIGTIDINIRVVLSQKSLLILIRFGCLTLRRN